jgi:NADH:ubiquinone oxidoreductase subunit 2 (subunit N)
MNTELNQFLLGAIVMACTAIGVFFIRFWRKSHDRLFAILAVAFLLLAINWLALALSHQDELSTIFYAIRFLAFLMIIVGIIDKNRGSRSRDIAP